ncbi:hormonally up-regulated neu tumor-associated kinase homolog isoform X1 [Ostrea edulis]|uniref:hormonally up-regulated neu tumor-associated kinase homolog isoform X1 n=1 Tax=Ostrea edulis TaxID=37623 RepID=UPI0024AE97D1|nr:hormonally up-regulated neu tumor-associated kinase homolog isoform X1 [Ostrea edulis]
MGKKIQCLGRYVMDCQTLGKGSFARVELATHGVTGCKVAIKIIDTRKIKDEYCRQNLHREARILAQLRHPNIIRLYETLKATTLYCLVLEGALGGDLMTFIRTHKQFYLPEDKARDFLRQLVSAIHYLHERGVSHRDLKMENIMLDEKRKNIKIVDFGLSNTYNKDELMKTRCGSLEYAAPELFHPSDKYGPEVDVWALGVITYAMVIGKLPFTTPYTDQYRRQKLLQQVEKGITELQLKEMCHLTEELKQLLCKLLEPNPSHRLPLMDVEIHPWVTCDAKMPFYPFHAFPRDKLLKSQVIDELTEMMNMNKEQVEKTVHESKCDELSAMFNMMMDNKRKEKGVFDLDYTSFHERRREKRESKAATSNPSLQKEGSGTQMTEAERLQAAHDHKVSTAFDFMALCSAPTWLEGKKRRSRRRKNPLQSPLPSAAAEAESVQHSTETLIVSQGTPDNPNLLSPGQAQTPFNRRSLRRRSSKRRTGPRSSSYGPGQRRTNSMKEQKCSSQPNSPILLINPEIKIDPPISANQTPRSARTPFHSESVTLLVPNQKQHKSCSDVTDDSSHDESDQNCSDAFCPYSASYIHSDEIIPVLVSKTTTSTAEIHSRQSKPLLEAVHQDSVEAKIASVDIKAIVRPKNRLISPSRNGQIHTTVDHFARNEKECNYSSSGSCDENYTMQKSDIQVMSEGDSQDEACGGCDHVDGNIPNMSQDVGVVCLSDIECSEDQSDSRTNLLNVVNPSSVVKEIHHPLKGRRINSKDQKVNTTLIDLKPSKICTPQKLDLKLPVVKNFPVAQSVHAKDIANESSSEMNVPESSTHPNLPEDKLSPLTPSESYSKHLYKFAMPNTPTRNMFKTPLARIESFHSDDFDFLLTNPELKSTATTPSSCVQTPTLPCFGYKLNLKKKNAKLKSDKAKQKSSPSNLQGSTKYANEESDVLECQSNSADPLSAGAGTDQSRADDGLEKGSTVSKAKIHPMDKEDQETELLIKGSKISQPNQRNRCLTNCDSTDNEIKGKNTQNCSDKNGKHNTETKKFIKCSPWKHGFVQFLRKKKPSHPHRGQNNNDSVHSNHHVDTRNGHARLACNSSLLRPNQDDSSSEMETAFSPSPIPVFSDNLEVRASPVPGHITPSSSATKVFDFTVVSSESPQAKSCLLSWKGCRDCAYSDDQQSDDGGSECTFRFEQSVDVAIKTSMAIKNVQDAKKYSAYKKYAHT